VTLTRYKHGGFLLALAVGGGLLSLYLGQDVNWDLKNYHLYNPWAFLTHRDAVDIHVAGLNSYFAPYIDLPYWLLANRIFPTSPRLVGFIMGLPFGVLAYLVWMLALELLSNQEDLAWKQRQLLAVLAAALGLSGAVSVSEVGTTFNDIPTAVLIVGSLYIVCICGRGAWTKGLEVTGRRKLGALLLASGGLLGLAAALKLTTCIYAPGAAIAAAFTGAQMEQRFSRFVLFCAGWLIAFALAWGPWAWHIFTMTGSPTFPLFNSIFHSAWASSDSALDHRFLPKSLVQALFYPFYWIDNPSMTVMEPRFADPRFAFGFAAVIVGLSATSYAILRRTLNSAVAIDTRWVAMRSLYVFVIVSYAIWELLFSYLRYAVTLECLIGVVVLGAVTFAFRTIGNARIFWPTLVCLLAVLGFSTNSTIYPAWGRQPFGSQVFDVRPPVLPEHSLVLFLRAPLAYAAPYIARQSPDVQFVGLHFDGFADPQHELGQRISDRISHWTGPIYFVARSETLDSDSSLSAYHLFPAGPCDAFHSNIDAQLWLCPLSGSPQGYAWPSTRENRAYVAGTRISLAQDGQGARYTTTGWADPEPWGRWIASPSACIELDLGRIPDGDLLLDLEGRPFLTPEHQRMAMRVLVNQVLVISEILDYRPDQTVRHLPIRIPRSVAKAQGEHLSIEFQFDGMASPAELHMSTDTRLLSLGVTDFSLQALP